jgi:type I restriction enzyme S subunit
MPSELTRFLRRKYGPDSDRIAEIEENWRIFKPFADPDFAISFCSDKEEEFQQRYWELWLGAWLLRQGIPLLPNTGHGPDFGFELDGRRVWIEAISPGPGQGANRVPEQVYQDLDQPLAAQDVPAREMLLRHTAAVREKIRKYETYAADGIVRPEDACIIAIDSSQVGLWGYQGISGFPTALEAVYPVGPQEVHFPLGGGGEVSTTIQHRPAITNANQAEVPTNVFLRAENARISGILAGSQGAAVRVYPPRPLVFISNKLARVPLLPLPFAVDEEYRLEDAPNGYNMRRLKNEPVQGAG